MMMEHSDSERMSEFVINDPNAQLFVLRGGWVLELFARGIKDPKVLKRQSQRLAKVEEKFVRELVKSGREVVYSFSFAELMSDPEMRLSTIQETLRPEVDLRPMANLRLRDFSGLRDFVGGLEAMGLDLSRFGTLPHQLPHETVAHQMHGKTALG